MLAVFWRVLPIVDRDDGHEACGCHAQLQPDGQRSRAGDMNARLGIVLICCFIDLRMQTIKCVVVGDGAVGKVRPPLHAPVSTMCR